MNFRSLHLDKPKSDGEKVSVTRMDSKNLIFTKHALCVLLATLPLCELRAQAPADPAAPAAPAEPANEMEALYNDAERAFTQKDYKGAIAKIEELLGKIKDNKAVPAATFELLRFNVGLGYLLDNDGPKAEAAFTECLKLHPRGEYTSRCFLGVGRACILQNTPEKKEKAIDALKQAALDPKYRSEAGLSLGQVYNDLQRPEEAFKVFRSLMGSDVRTPQQTNAAVEVISLLADGEKLDDLTAYLDRVINQSGIRDAIAWYTNQVIVKGDEIVDKQGYETALALYRSIPPRRQILNTQRSSIEDQKKQIAVLEKRIADEIAAKVPLAKRSASIGEALANYKASLTINEQALTAIDGKADLDAALLLRRGRALYYLDRFEEALVCFRSIRTQHPESADLESAAYSEIFVFNQLQNTGELEKLAADFLVKYPKSANIQQVAMLAGQGLANAGKWDEALAFYADMEKKFPDSSSLDRYVFFQGVALFRLARFAEAGTLFSKFVSTYPNSDLYEDALYQVAMANFVEGKFKATLASCQAYLQRYPNGRYSGDIRYRLAYIDFRDEQDDQSLKLVKDINAFVAANPDDPSAGMMLNLLGDVYTQKKSMQALKDSPDKALDAYKRAAASESQTDVISYAVDQAIIILQQKKDWSGLSALCSMIMQRYPDSALSLKYAPIVAKMMAREGKSAEAADLLATQLKESIADPANEQVEPLLEEIARTLMPKRVRGVEPNLDEVLTQLNGVVDRAAAGKENPTTNARKVYAQARLADMLRFPDRADLFLKGLAANADPAILSPLLLYACGDILLKTKQLDQAQAMFQRIVDRFPESPFSDAGPVGLGQVALARKEYQKAYDTFNDALENSPGSSRAADATVGKLEALIKLGKLDDAEKLGTAILNNREFKGEPQGQTYLLLGDLFHAKAVAGNPGADKEESLRKANGYYQNAFGRFGAYPDIAAWGLLKSYDMLTELGEKEAADKVMEGLKNNPKWDKTPGKKEAENR